MRCSETRALLSLSRAGPGWREFIPKLGTLSFKPQYACPSLETLRLPLPLLGIERDSREQKTSVENDPSRQGHTL